MRILILGALSALLLSGCSQIVDRRGSEESTVQVASPKWEFQIKASGSLAEGQTTIPKAVYVFPPLRMNQQGQPIDSLKHRTEADGSLTWVSLAPKAMETQAVVEKKFRKLGYNTLTFQEMTEWPRAHSVLVVNLYYIEPRTAGASTGDALTVFVRMTASTFPMDLDPAKKRDIMTLEGVTLFDPSFDANSVMKTSLDYLLDNLGRTGEWRKSLSLLR